VTDGSGHQPIVLREWEGGDLPLLVATLGDPAMTRYLGGPETPEQIAARHLRYVNLAGSETGHMYVILEGSGLVAVGSIGYWESSPLGDPIFEMGWGVLPAHQGRGVASRAVPLILARARAEQRHRYVHAFPAVDNGPSNAVCRKAGFSLLGPHEFEYPKGHQMLCNDWSFDLQAASSLGR
jgi:RimJ/RimL family protein N-acetyltransferase